MKLTIIIVVIVVIIAREFVAAALWKWGEGEDYEITLSERLANIKDKWHTVDAERVIEEVTIGWRKSEDQQERVNGNGVIEYYKRIR